MVMTDDTKHAPSYSECVFTINQMAVRRADPMAELTTGLTRRLVRQFWRNSLGEVSTLSSDPFLVRATDDTV